MPMVECNYIGDKLDGLYIEYYSNSNIKEKEKELN